MMLMKYLGNIYLEIRKYYFLIKIELFRAHSRILATRIISKCCENIVIYLDKMEPSQYIYNVMYVTLLAQATNASIAVTIKY